MSAHLQRDMFSHGFYNVMHIVGIVMLMSALGGISVHAASGGTRATSGARALVMALHGTGLLLILVAGFGMLARLGFMHGARFPGWVWAKIVIWIVLGAAAVLPYRWPSTARAMLLLLPVLGGLAAYLAIFKPI